MSGTNVLRVNAAEERTDYRRAVAAVIKSIITEHNRNLVQIAESIDVSLGTISNALNEKTDLCPTYLNRLGKVYGCEMLNPFAMLCGGQMVRREADENADALPSTTAAIHKLAVARSPGSDGGERITHRELLGMEGEIDAALRALTALKMRCERARAA